ncbi:hypothetical protein E4U38_006092, partial [Claviceps purpurea]
MPVTRMMNLIKVDCGFEADIAIIVLLSRFSESNRSNFSTTRAWLDHHQDLWARINKIEPIWDEYSAAPINIHRNLGTLRVHEGGELFELGGELAEAVRMNSFKPPLCISMRGSS